MPLYGRKRKAGNFTDNDQFALNFIYNHLLLHIGRLCHVIGMNDSTVMNAVNEKQDEKVPFMAINLHSMQSKQNDSVSDFDLMKTTFLKSADLKSDQYRLRFQNS